MVQNNAARLVLKKKKSDHVTPLLKHLHWLPIKQRIEFKINLITYKALHDQAPSYISELLEPYEPTRSLRSSVLGLLKEKKTRLKRSGDRAFSVIAPKLWNRLPECLRKAESVECFKSNLKTYLFKIVSFYHFVEIFILKGEHYGILIDCDKTIFIYCTI